MKREVNLDRKVLLTNMRGKASNETIKGTLQQILPVERDFQWNSTLLIEKRQCDNTIPLT